MKLNFRTYQKTQTKSILKKNNFLLFTIGANQNSVNWSTIEQNLHKLNIFYVKIYNNVTKKNLIDSIGKKLKDIVHSTVFLLTPQDKTKIIKSNLLNEVNANRFDLIALKLNKKLYSASQLKTLNSFNQKKNIAIAYQLLCTSLKSSLRFK